MKAYLRDLGYWMYVCLCVKVSLIKLHFAGFMRDVSAFTTQRVLIRKRMLNRFGLRQRQWRNNSAFCALSYVDSVNRWQRQERGKRVLNGSEISVRATKPHASFKCSQSAAWSTQTHWQSAGGAWVCVCVRQRKRMSLSGCLTVLLCVCVWWKTLITAKHSGSPSKAKGYHLQHFKCARHIATRQASPPPPSS